MFDFHGESFNQIPWCVADTATSQLFFFAETERLAKAQNKVLEQNGLSFNQEKEVFERHKKLWRSVQLTLASVTESYSTTYSLNTVVSDLMSLTKELNEASSAFTVRKDRTSMLHGFELHYCAVIALVKMMAPISPAFADHCWSMLKQPAAISPKFWPWKTVMGKWSLVSVHSQFGLKRSNCR